MNAQSFPGISKEYVGQPSRLSSRSAHETIITGINVGMRSRYNSTFLFCSEGFDLFVVSDSNQEYTPALTVTKEAVCLLWKSTADHFVLCIVLFAAF